LDPTIISLLTKTAGQVRYHGFPKENNYIPKGYHGFLTFSSFFILFHPFSKKKDEKGRDRKGYQFSFGKP